MPKTLFVRIATGTLLLLCAVVLLSAQSGQPTADQPYAGDRNVTGSAPGATSLIVYDVTSSAKRYLGSSNSIDKDGNFAVAVNPPLVLDQKIVVVDSQGRSSAAITVITKSGPAGGPQESR